MVDGANRSSSVLTINKWKNKLSQLALCKNVCVHKHRQEPSPFLTRCNKLLKHPSSPVPSPIRGILAKRPTTWPMCVPCRLLEVTTRLYRQSGQCVLHVIRIPPCRNTAHSAISIDVIYGPKNTVTAIDNTVVYVRHSPPPCWTPPLFTPRFNLRRLKLMTPKRNKAVQTGRKLPVLTASFVKSTGTVVVVIKNKRTIGRTKSHPPVPSKQSFYLPLPVKRNIRLVGLKKAVSPLTKTSLEKTVITRSPF